MKKMTLSLSAAIMALTMSMSASAMSVTEKPSTKVAVTANPVPNPNKDSKKDVRAKLAYAQLKLEEFETNYINTEAQFQDYNIDDIKSQMAVVKEIMKSHAKSNSIVKEATSLLSNYQILLDKVEHTLNKD